MILSVRTPKLFPYIKCIAGLSPEMNKAFATLKITAATQ